MITMYREGAECRCHGYQIPLMEKSGWSRVADPEKDAAEQEALAALQAEQDAADDAALKAAADAETKAETAAASRKAKGKK